MPHQHDHAHQRVRRLATANAPGQGQLRAHDSPVRRVRTCYPVRRIPCVVLKPSGAVITQDAYNNVVKKVWSLTAMCTGLVIHATIKWVR